ncbi:MAG: glycosyltransferase family 9 protein [Bacteriovoracia bacterium]
MPTQKPKLMIVKLAAIGDVALAIKATRAFSERLSRECEVNWVLDKAFEQMVIKLTQGISKLSFQFHHVDSKALFQGDFSTKLNIAIQLLLLTQKIKPDCVVLLHRDWRYLVPLRLGFGKRLIHISREKRHEYDIYLDALIEAARDLGIYQDHNHSTGKIRTHKTNSSAVNVGVLIGGGRNQKGSFAEKRWPHLFPFLEQLMLESRKIVTLFGGSEDVKFGNEIMEKAAQMGWETQRIINRVGQLQLEDLPDEFKNLDVFVSVDSGLAHLAAASMTKESQTIITLFGPTDPHGWMPRTDNAHSFYFYKKQNCSPCYQNDGNFRKCLYQGEDFQKCMKAISPLEVFEKVLAC